LRLDWRFAIILADIIDEEQIMHDHRSARQLVTCRLVATGMRLRVNSR